METILGILCESGKEVDILFYGDSHLVLETDIPSIMNASDPPLRKGYSEHGLKQ